MQLPISKIDIKKKYKDLCKLDKVKKSLPKDSLFMVCNDILTDSITSYKVMYKVQKSNKTKAKIKTLSDLKNQLNKNELTNIELYQIIEYGVKMYKSLRDNYGQFR